MSLAHVFRAAARLQVLAVLLVLLGLVVTPATPADAAATYQARVVDEAAHHKGAPYSYGAAGPTRFDCSGFTLYVFGRFGKRLPHNSAQQYQVVHHVAKSQLTKGDLLFFRSSSGSITHVAIYAGNGYMWHAPHSGSVVQVIKIYSSNYLVGRI